MTKAVIIPGTLALIPALLLNLPSICSQALILAFILGFEALLARA
jgi:hypothetical protein